MPSDTVNKLRLELAGRISHSIVEELPVQFDFVDHIILDFKKVSFVTLPGAMYLLCYIATIKKNHDIKRLVVEINNMSNVLRVYLQKIGFFSQLQATSSFTAYNSDISEVAKILKEEADLIKAPHNSNGSIIMPISTIMQGNQNAYEDYVRKFKNDFISYFYLLEAGEYISRREAPFTDTLFDDFFRALHEIIKNIFDHSKSWGLGAIQANKKTGLQICYFDIGIGIIESVKRSNIANFSNEEDYVVWALADGNTSRGESNTNFGRGFTTIVSFAQSRNGIFSLKTGHYHMNNGRIKKANYFPGTQIVLHIPSMNK